MHFNLTESAVSLVSILANGLDTGRTGFAFFHAKNCAPQNCLMSESGNNSRAFWQLINSWAEQLTNIRMPDAIPLKKLHQILFRQNRPQQSITNNNNNNNNDNNNNNN